MKKGSLFILIFFWAFISNAQDRLFNNSVSLIQDNDILKIRNQTDHYYSFGMFLNYNHSLREEAKILKLIPFKKFNNTYIWHAQLSMEAYTPRENMGDSVIIDRPFSGMVLGRIGITQANPKRLIRIRLEAGLRGPAVRAGQFQNWLHGLIGSDRVEGWENQLPNQFLLNGYITYAKPFNLTKRIEFIVQSDAAVGNNQTYLQQGGTLRIGWFNPINKSSLYGMDLGRADRERLKEFFLTTTLYGRISIVNTTLSNERVSQGDVFEINKNNFLLGLEIKAHAQFSRWGTSFAYHKVSPNTDITFSHSYGSIGISYRW